MNKAITGLLTNRWGFFFVILPHITFYYFKVEPLKPVIQAWQLAVFLPVLLFVFTRINILNVLLTVSMSLVLISAYTNGTITGGVFYSVIVFLGFCFYITYATEHFKEFITGLYYLLVFVVVANFLTMIISPVQFDGRYLLGGKNALQVTLLPAIPLVYIYSYFRYKKLRVIPLIVILIAILSMYLSQSGTATVIAILTLVFALFPKRISPTFNAYLYGYIAIFLSIVVYRLQEVMFGDFIKDVLQKDLTFTGRTYIWDFVMYLMNEYWFLGVGRGSTIIRDNNYFNVIDTHNGVLEVMMFSGVIGLALYFIMLLMIGQKLKQERKHVISKVLSFSLFAYMIIGLTESVFYRIEFWLLLVISYNIDKIVKQSEPVQETTHLQQNKMSA